MYQSPLISNSFKRYTIITPKNGRTPTTTNFNDNCFHDFKNDSSVNFLNQKNQKYDEILDNLRCSIENNNNNKFDYISKNTELELEFIDNSEFKGVNIGSNNRKFTISPNCSFILKGK